MHGLGLLKLVPRDSSCGTPDRRELPPSVVACILLLAEVIMEFGHSQALGTPSDFHPGIHPAGHS